MLIALMTLVWTECVDMAWTPSDPPATGYHVEVGDHLVDDVVEPLFRLCLPLEYFPVKVRVQGFTPTTVGPWSDFSDEVLRLHIFDTDGDDSVGMTDFGRFVQSFSCKYMPSGIAKCPKIGGDND